MLWQAMCSLDTDTQAPRGYLVIDKAPPLPTDDADSAPTSEPPGLHQLMHRLHGMGAKICPPGSCDDGERTYIIAPRGLEVDSVACKLEDYVELCQEFVLA